MDNSQSLALVQPEIPEGSKRSVPGDNRGLCLTPGVDKAIRDLLESGSIQPEDHRVGLDSEREIEMESPATLANTFRLDGVSQR